MIKNIPFYLYPILLFLKTELAVSSVKSEDDDILRNYVYYYKRFNGRYYVVKIREVSKGK